MPAEEKQTKLKRNSDDYLPMINSEKIRKCCDRSCASRVMKVTECLREQIAPPHSASRKLAWPGITRQMLGNLCELEANLVYIASSSQSRLHSGTLLSRENVVQFGRLGTEQQLEFLL